MQGRIPRPLLRKTGFRRTSAAKRDGTWGGFPWGDRRGHGPHGRRARPPVTDHRTHTATPHPVRPAGRTRAELVVSNQERLKEADRLPRRKVSTGGRRTAGVTYHARDWGIAGNHPTTDQVVHAQRITVRKKVYAIKKSQNAQKKQSHPKLSCKGNGGDT